MNNNAMTGLAPEDGDRRGRQRDADEEAATTTDDDGAAAAPPENAPERDDPPSSEGKDPSSYSDDDDDDDDDDEGDAGRGDEDGGAEEAAADDSEGDIVVGEEEGENVASPEDLRDGAETTTARTRGTETATAPGADDGGGAPREGPDASEGEEEDENAPDSREIEGAETAPAPKIETGTAPDADAENASVDDDAGKKVEEGARAPRSRKEEENARGFGADDVAIAETDPGETAEAAPNGGNGRPANDDAASKVDDARVLSALARPRGEGETGEEPPSRTSGEEGSVAEGGPVEESRPGESDAPHSGSESRSKERIIDNDRCDDEADRFVRLASDDGDGDEGRRAEVGGRVAVADRGTGGGRTERTGGDEDEDGESNNVAPMEDSTRDEGGARPSESESPTNDGRRRYEVDGLVDGNRAEGGWIDATECVAVDDGEAEGGRTERPERDNAPDDAEEGEFVAIELVSPTNREGTGTSGGGDDDDDGPSPRSALEHPATGASKLDPPDPADDDDDPRALAEAAPPARAGDDGDVDPTARPPPGRRVLRHPILTPLARLPWDRFASGAAGACDLFFNCRYSMRQVEDEVREEHRRAGTIGDLNRGGDAAMEEGVEEDIHGRVGREDGYVNLSLGHEEDGRDRYGDAEGDGGEGCDADEFEELGLRCCSMLDDESDEEVEVVVSSTRRRRDGPLPDHDRQRRRPTSAGEEEETGEERRWEPPADRGGQRAGVEGEDERRSATTSPASSDPGFLRDERRRAEESWKESNPSLDMMLYRTMINK